MDIRRVIVWLFLGLLSVPSRMTFAFAL